MHARRIEFDLELSVWHKGLRHEHLVAQNAVLEDAFHSLRNEVVSDAVFFLDTVDWTAERESTFDEVASRLRDDLDLLWKQAIQER